MAARPVMVRVRRRCWRWWCPRSACWPSSASLSSAWRPRLPRASTTRSTAGGAHFQRTTRPQQGPGGLLLCWVGWGASRRWSVRCAAWSALAVRIGLTHRPWPQETGETASSDDNAALQFRTKPCLPHEYPVRQEGCLNRWQVASASRLQVRSSEARSTARGRGSQGLAAASLCGRVGGLPSGTV